MPSILEALGAAPKKKRASRKGKIKAVKLEAPVEPEYFYIKGQGWVPCLEEPPETTWFDVGKYRVTLIKRRPQIGENYLTEYYEKKKAVANVQRQLQEYYWARLFETLNTRDLKYHFSRWTQRDDRYKDRGAVHIVIQMERIRGR